MLIFMAWRRSNTSSFPCMTGDVRVCDMEDSHLLNVIRYLHRNYGIVAYAGPVGCVEVSGEDAVRVVLKRDRHPDSPDIGEIYEELIGEALRRGLGVLYRNDNLNQVDHATTSG